MTFTVESKTYGEIELLFKNKDKTYQFLSKRDGQKYIEFIINDSNIKIVYINDDIDMQYSENLENRVVEFLSTHNLIEEWGSEDTENEEDDISEESPYDPDKIRVDTKPFSLRQIYDMIKDGDIDLSPDFQRNLVWDSQRKSRLIESILMRIPLPIFYFAEDSDGRISVVDGLQRLSTIFSFMNNELKLKNLEYLEEKCGGKIYKDDKNLNNAIEGKYFRWFNSTQITANVIDPSSPFKLKYDIFRRINTGGLPLNAQEIRNCLAGKDLRLFLRNMSKSIEFKNATDNSIKDTRLEDQEFVLRFILFYEKYSIDNLLDNYTGTIDYELNQLTETLSKAKNASEFNQYETLFLKAMKNCYYAFGKYGFRKILTEHLVAGARKQLINKALFVVWSILLSQYDYEDLKSNYKELFLVELLADEITNDDKFFAYLTYGTNSKINIQFVFSKCKEILNKVGL